MIPRMLEDIICFVCSLDIAEKSSQEATSAWIGLVDTAENFNHTADCTCWKWLDGSPYTYQNFAPGQPNNAEEKEWCSEIFLPGSNYPAGTWNDELCEEYTRPAVCSVPANPTPTTGEATQAGPMKPSTPLALTASTQPKPSVTSTKTPATTAKTQSCPAGWDYCPEASRCHKVPNGILKKMGGGNVFQNTPFGYTLPKIQNKRLPFNLVYFRKSMYFFCPRN